MPDDVTALRLQLVAHGYVPIPLFGKEPPVYGKNNQRKGFSNWQKLDSVTPEMVEMWAKTWPDARNTGVLTERVPTLDADVLNPEAVRAIAELVHERYDERGYVLTRSGLPPKIAIPFWTDEPFDKIVVNLVAPNGDPAKPEKIEFLGTGQQVVVAGIHPDTGKPYGWHGGEPYQMARDELPYIREAEARALVDDIVALLVRDFGYTRAKGRPGKRKKGNGAAAQADAAEAGAAADDWAALVGNIQQGQNLHDSLRDLAAKMVKSGMQAGAVVNYLRGLMDAATCPHDERWRDRRGEIPRLVDGAVEKYAKAPEEPTAEAKPSAGDGATTIEQTLTVFDHWLVLKSPTPIYAVLGTVAANLLPGDAVWCGLIGPPSSAKTEILNSLAQLPKVVQAATLTAAALLSGTPTKQRDKGAKGGLLRQIGDFGIISLKDLGSILSMHPETRAELLAALREIYDGAWTRHFGTDGGKTLAWKGKVEVVFGATPVIDTFHGVISEMGDRWLLSRLAPVKGQFQRALKHGGKATTQMRQELAEAVAQLFAGRRAEPRPISEDEIERIDRTINLVVRLRGTVVRDRRTRELDMILGAEGTARIGLALERLLAGTRHARSRARDSDEGGRERGKGFRAAAAPHRL